MALITCPSCGRRISNLAKACPGCSWRPPDSDVSPVEATSSAHDESSEPERPVIKKDDIHEPLGNSPNERPKERLLQANAGGKEPKSSWGKWLIVWIVIIIWIRSWNHYNPNNQIKLPSWLERVGHRQAIREGSESVQAPQRKGEGVVKNSLGMKLAYIPPGKFAMGSPGSEMDCLDNEKPHQVRLTKGFYIGTHEITQFQFQRVLWRNPARFSADGVEAARVSEQDTSSFPVEMVTWYDAVEFCNALSKREGLPEYYTLRNVERENAAITSADVKNRGGVGYRLPTEAEWEYACRAGTITAFHFGDVLNGNEANVNGDGPYGTSTKGPHLARPREVGGYAPNKFGLFDMHGNVWEWCNDWYGDYGGDAVDPRGAVSGESRVLRGGSFFEVASNVRSARRFSLPPGRRGGVVGFRVARTHP